jgi:hypothetical protein
MGKLLSASLAKATDARAELPEATHNRITLLDQGYMVGPGTPIVKQMLDAAQAGFDHDQLVQLFEELRSRCFCESTLCLFALHFWRPYVDNGVP